MSIPTFEMPTPWVMVSPELCLRREPPDEVLSLLCNHEQVEPEHFDRVRVS